jgi:hypothetical protein
MSRPAPPIVFFAFANDRVDTARYLRNLPEELRRIREAMAAAEQAGLCEVRDRGNATVVEVLNFFQDARFRNRVAIFHFGGHAGSGVLLFESPDGAAKAAHGGGFARFLGEQRGLALVFLNGCSTQGQVENLLAAGVPAVIATSEDIPDAVATELSSRFYKAIASGAPLHAAFNEAAAAVQTLTGQEAKPWDLYVKPGAEERVERWSLPVAARDPLFGLPALPEMDLPRAPFKHLAPFTRADAHVFFGRGREIRELFEAVTLSDAPPVVLLFGVAGAGKSSLLAAGLQPRLEVSHEVLYLRRDGVLGLTGTLTQALPDWREREERTGKPLIVILDQAEEAWTRPLTGGGEIEAFAAALRALFAVRESRPQGRLILGFRKEWLAEILRLLDAEELPRTRVEVPHLDQNGVLEAVAGTASTGRLKRQYRLCACSGGPEPATEASTPTACRAKAESEEVAADPWITTPAAADAGTGSPAEKPVSPGAGAGSPAQKPAEGASAPGSCTASPMGSGTKPRKRAPGAGGLATQPTGCNTKPAADNTQSAGANTSVAGDDGGEAGVATGNAGDVMGIAGCVAGGEGSAAHRVTTSEASGLKPTSPDSAPRLPEVILRGASATQRIWGMERSARPDPSRSQGSHSG